jgi:hypothetical protein
MEYAVIGEEARTYPCLSFGMMTGIMDQQPGRVIIHATDQRTPAYWREVVFCWNKKNCRSTGGEHNGLFFLSRERAVYLAKVRSL